MRTRKKRQHRPKNYARKYQQAGKSNKSFDRRFVAFAPGWRLSSGGNWYFENRANRSDRDRRQRL